MPIPLLDPSGLLPAGCFDCTLTEVRERFGTFQSSDRRIRLFTVLAELVLGMQRSGIFDAVILDGSFVTSKPVPNDLDLIAVLRADHDLERDLPISEYALVSPSHLRRRAGLDVLVAKRNSELYKKYVEFFGRVRDLPGAAKGLLQLPL